jgi:alpha-methylacyl-CoA racemase
MISAVSGERQGPLRDLRVVELAGLAPVPFGAMLLADLGADVLRIDRASPGAFEPLTAALGRGRRSVALDLKRAGAADVVLRLVERADALLEGFRPGVMERLGLGPDACLARNERLVYARMTGWGQDGPLAQRPGHDLNYIALSGALGAIGRAGQLPVPPLNLLADFGGGGMLLALGVVSAVLEARSSGRGQVVDAAMTDGSALLMTMIYGARGAGLWSTEHGTNVLDGGAPFYDVYATSDGGAVAVACLEPRFFAELLRLLDLERPDLSDHTDPARWPAIRAALTETFASRTRDEWEAVFAGSETCVVPVLDLDEAPRHPHNAARRTFYDAGGGVLPMPAPRFGRTPPARPGPTSAPGADTTSALAEWGFAESEIRALLERGIAFEPAPEAG